MNHHKSFIKATIIVAACSFLSRILGLLRSTLLSSFFGATESNGITDCYSASFKLPDIIYNLVVFGVVSIVLIPYFSSLIKKEKNEKLKEAVNQFLNFFFFLLLFFMALGFFFAPFLVKNFLLKGWSDAGNIMLTVRMTRILFLQMLFMSLSGIFSSYLNALERFTAYSVALLTYNIGIIFGILFLTPFIGIEGAAWGAVIGSFFQFMIQAVSSYKTGYSYSFELPRFNKEIKELAVIAIPRIIALSGEQLVKFAIVYIASFLFAGSIFIFENAENFSMVAFGMIAVSVSTTAFPAFSKLFVEGNFNKLVNSLLEKVKFTLFFIMPLTAVMMIYSREIVELLLGYNKFTTHDVTLTANALFYYMPGIPFFSITIILVKFYYAQKKSFAPMCVTLLSVITTIICSYFLSRIFSITGLSIARSAGYAVQTILLILFISIIYKMEKISVSINKMLFFDIFKITFISLLFFFAGLIFKDMITFSSISRINSLLKLCIEGGFLGSLYIALMYILKVSEAENSINLILKKVRRS